MHGHTLAPRSQSTVTHPTPPTHSQHPTAAHLLPPRAPAAALPPAPPRARAAPAQRPAPPFSGGLLHPHPLDPPAVGFSVCVCMTKMDMKIRWMPTHTPTPITTNNNKQKTNRHECTTRHYGDNIGGRNYEASLSYGPIDVVYTWVNGSDPRWLAAKRRYERWVTDEGGLRERVEVCLCACLCHWRGRTENGIDDSKIQPKTSTCTLRRLEREHAAAAQAEGETQAEENNKQPPALPATTDAAQQVTGGVGSGRGSGGLRRRYLRAEGVGGGDGGDSGGSSSGSDGSDDGAVVASSSVSSSSSHERQQQQGAQGGETLAVAPAYKGPPEEVEDKVGVLIYI